MTDFICFKCKSKIQTKPWGKTHIEVKCSCPHEADYVRTDDDDDAIEKFLTAFQLVDPEIDNRGEPWSDSAAKHLEELWFTNPERLAKTELKNNLSKRFGRSMGAITSQLKHMKDSDTQKHESTHQSKSFLDKLAHLKPKLKNNLSKRFGRSGGDIASQLKHMKDSDTQKHESTHQSKSPIDVLSQQNHESTDKSKNLIAKLIRLKPELTRETIEQKIVEKKDNPSGKYLTDEAALFLIASDYGFTLTESESIEPKVQPVVTRSKYPLYHLSSIRNLESILYEGILSHDLSMKKNPKRISDSEIVERRKLKILPSGYSLTHYANFYFKPENAMLWRILKEAETNYKEDLENSVNSDNHPNNIIIFEINLDLNQQGIFVSDGNCANNITRIESVPAPDIFSVIDDVKPKSNWNGNEELKRKFQAECLVPQKVNVSSIHTIHVQNDTIQEKINDTIQEKFPNLRNIKVEINRSKFFS